MPVATLPAAANADAEIVPITLPGGFVAATTHTGPYDRLTEAHAAMQQWIESEGLKIAGPPWESYVTDPADYPDPKDWKTDLFWPVAEG
jgi:AraC family transcriptional regulator